MIGSGACRDPASTGPCGPSHLVQLSLPHVWATQLPDFSATERRHPHLMIMAREHVASDPHREPQEAQGLQEGPPLPWPYPRGNWGGAGTTLRLGRPWLPLPSLVLWTWGQSQGPLLADSHPHPHNSRSTSLQDLSCPKQTKGSELSPRPPRALLWMCSS